MGSFVEAVVLSPREVRLDVALMRKLLSKWASEMSGEGDRESPAHRSPEEEPKPAPMACAAPLRAR